MPHIRKSKGSYIHVSATLHYRGEFNGIHDNRDQLEPYHIATPYQVHVSAAKAGVDALSAVLAVEEGPWGVRSNVIAPGPIGGTEGMNRLSSQDPDAKQRSITSVPVQRLGDIRDIANAAVFLFSDAASFISGTILVVDGASEHIRTPQLPYPESVLNPKAMISKIKPRL